MEPNVTVRHITGATNGGVDHKVAHTTTGITLETDCACPRLDGESEAALVTRSALLATSAVVSMLESLRAAGIEVGPFKKQEKAQ